KFDVVAGNVGHVEFMLPGDTGFHRDLNTKVKSRFVFTNLMLKVCDAAHNICEDEEGNIVRIESQRRDIFLGETLTSVTSGPRKNYVEVTLGHGEASIPSLFFNASGV